MMRSTSQALAKMAMAYVKDWQAGRMNDTELEEGFEAIFTGGLQGARREVLLRALISPTGICELIDCETPAVFNGHWCVKHLIQKIERGEGRRSAAVAQTHLGCQNYPNCETEGCGPS